MNTEKMIGFEEFADWHSPDGEVIDSKLAEAYEVYKRLFTEGGKEFADDKICGHEVWDE